MKSKKYLALFSLLVISMLLLTSCSKQEAVPTSTVFMGGTKGITLEFEPFGVEENNLYTIFDTETFPLEVTLRNKGEYEIKSGDITVNLLGPSQKEFTGISSWELKNKDALDKISELVTEGGEETITFATDAKYSGEVVGLQERTWFANLDYNYETYVLIPEVCLKEDLTDTRVCEVVEAKTFHVSGAPIIIKSVEESTAGKGIMALKIKISNAGSGKVTKQGVDFGTREELTYTIDDTDWECKSGGKVDEARLISGEAEVVCKLKNPLAADTLSTQQVKLTLTYKYRDLIQEKLAIKESAN
ncbi:MAG: hypothetical protein ABIA37_03430 [Candidatus Woesearchaeota archaeon]